MLGTDAAAVGGTAAELVEIARNGAVALAEAGFWVVRLHYPIFNGQAADGSLIVTCSCGKPGCKDSAGKHPVDSAWGKGATRDVETVKRWFDGEPGRGGGSWKPWNVGIVLGLCHGIPPEEAVIDVEDDTDEGRELATELFGEDIHGSVYSSGGKSLHRLFRWSEGLPPVANLKVRGLEFRFGGRGKETQSVAPPSVHRAGRRYEWLAGGVGGKRVELPDSVKAFLLEEFERQRKHHATNGNGHAGGGASGGSGSRGAVNRLHAPIGKIGEGARHHALLTFANSRWRWACNSVGIARLEDSDIEDEILMDVLGRNLLVCQPPKTDDEVRVIVRSSRTFMMSEILREVDEKRVLSGEVPVGNAELTPGVREIGDFLRTFGIRLKYDTASKVSEERIDRWVAEDWTVRNLKGSDEDRVEVTVAGGVSVVISLLDFEKPEKFARQIYDASGGAVNLTLLVSAFFNFSNIWNGYVTSKKKGGITLGLHHYLFGIAKVIDDVELSLKEQVEEVIRGLAVRSRDEVLADLKFIEECDALDVKGFSDIRIGANIGRSRDDGLGLSRIERMVLASNKRNRMSSDDEPLTGWVRDGETGKVGMWAKFDEIVKKYRASYGSGVHTKKLSDAMHDLGFSRKKVTRGERCGRWLVNLDFGCGEVGESSGAGVVVVDSDE